VKTLFDEFGRGSIPRLPRHKNPGLEIVYLRYGRLVWECEGKPESVESDSIYFTLPWQTHGSVTEFESGHEYHFVVIRLRDADTDGPGRFRFPPALALDAPTTTAVRQLLMGAPRHAWPASTLARVLLPELVRELEHPGSLHDAHLSHMTSQLILELARIVSMPQKPWEGNNTQRFSPLLVELECTCDQPWTLEEMARRLKLKNTRFNAIFRQAMGEAPMHYLSRLRVDRARQLLRNTTKTITEIAFECGFSSSQHFAHTFQQLSGETASAYRRLGPPQLTLPRSQHKG
jgi:AraC family L-rhamnose operon regulatory protein RhaS